MLKYRIIDKLNTSLPAKSLQLFAEIKYQQGFFDGNKAPSADLLSALKKASVDSASSIMATPPEFSVVFDYQSGIRYQSQLKTKQIQPNHLQEMHAHLNPKGGQWRTVRLKKSRRDVKGQVLHINNSGQQITDEIGALFGKLHEAKAQDYDPLLYIPLLLADVLRIFPFYDGNRRVCLLLARYLFSNNGHGVIRYVDLETEIAATNKAFYRALFQVSIEDPDNVSPWLSYWWVIINRLYQRYFRQIEHAAIKPGRGEKKALIKRYVQQQKQPFRFSEICQALPSISSETIRVTLRQLQQQGSVNSTGRGRAARWVSLY